MMWDRSMWSWLEDPGGERKVVRISKRDVLDNLETRRLKMK